MQKFGLLFLLLAFFSSCTKKDTPPSAVPTVLVTIAPYADLVEKIAGSTVKVTLLIPQGVNIHIYEPTPMDIAERARAALWFQIGEPIEKKVLRAFKDTNPSLTAVNLQEGLTLLSSADAIELTPCIGHDHGSHDLHTWMSLRNMIIQSRTITAFLSRLLPHNEELYIKNLQKLTVTLNALDKHITETLAPYKNTALLVSHPSFGYFCRDYGLLQLSVECEGKEPRPRDLEQIVKMASEYKVRCAFLQTGFDRRGALIIAKKLDIPTYSIDPYGKNYLDMLQQLAHDIAR